MVTEKVQIVIWTGVLGLITALLTTTTDEQKPGPIKPSLQAEGGLIHVRPKN